MSDSMTTVRLDDRVPRGNLWILDPNGRPLRKGLIEDMMPLPSMPGLNWLIALNPIDAKIMAARAKLQGHAIYPTSLQTIGGRQ